jgi:hypothetical protein
MIKAIKISTIVVEVVAKGTSKTITFKDVLYVPKMKKDSLLVSKLKLFG